MSTTLHKPDLENQDCWVTKLANDWQISPPIQHLHTCTRTLVQNMSCLFRPLQVMDTLSTAEALLGELAGFSSFRTEASELREELRDYQKEQVNSWSRQVLAAIDHPSEPLR